MVGVENYTVANENWVVANQELNCHKITNKKGSPTFDEPALSALYPL